MACAAMRSSVAARGRPRYEILWGFGAVEGHDGTSSDFVAGCGHRPVDAQRLSSSLANNGGLRVSVSAANAGGRYADSREMARGSGASVCRGPRPASRSAASHLSACHGVSDRGGTNQASILRWPCPSVPRREKPPRRLSPVRGTLDRNILGV